MRKMDKVLYGVIAGLILPVIGFFISYPIMKTPWLTFEKYVWYAMYTENQQNILIFCMIPNMLLFYFTNFRWDWGNFTKGLVGVTLVLMLGVFALTL